MTTETLEAPAVAEPVHTEQDRVRMSLLHDAILLERTVAMLQRRFSGNRPEWLDDLMGDAQHLAKTWREDALNGGFGAAGSDAEAAGGDSETPAAGS